MFQAPGVWMLSGCLGVHASVGALGSFSAPSDQAGGGSWVRFSNGTGPGRIVVRRNFELRCALVADLIPSPIVEGPLMRYGYAMCMRILAWVLLSGCGLPNLPPQPSDPVAAAPASPVVPAIDLPGDGLKLGFAARPARGARMETPVDAVAEVVMEVQPEDWAGVPLGAPAVGHGAGGAVALTYVGLTKISLGCDGGVEGDWARFDAAAPVPEGPVLVERAGGASYAGETIVAGAGRHWSLGALGTVSTASTGSSTAQVTIAPVNGTPVTRDFTKGVMDGYAGKPGFDLSDPDEIFLPTPVVALRAPDGSGRVILQWRSFEGIHYEVFALGATSAREGESYLSWCAF